MEENHQDKTGNKQIATEEKLWIPPLSPKEQKKAERLQKKPFAERMGFSGKTPWDWLQLLIQLLTALALPIALFIATQWFTTQQNKANEMAAATRYANDQLLAADQQRETTLQTYLDNMSDLLLKQNLAKSKPGDEVSQVARERTLTTLRRLDAKRNGIVLQFLRDAHLIGVQNAVIDLRYADLSHDDLSGANLSSADLQDANLSYANLYQAHLYQANLRGAHLYQANLRGADLRAAKLRHAKLSAAKLSYANLSAAKLYQADLSNADLYQAKLYQADLSNADLSAADLSDAMLNDTHLRAAFLYQANLNHAALSSADLQDANLRGADLRAANLSYAKLYQAHLYQANLRGADLRAATLRGANLDKTILKGARYNPKEILIRDSQGKIIDKIPPTQWPQGFDPKAAGATEANTFP